MVMNPLAMQETQVQSLGGEDPLEKDMATHSSILVWKIHGQRSLVGYSPWGRKELDTTEHAHTANNLLNHGHGKAPSKPKRTGFGEIPGW